MAKTDFAFFNPMRVRWAEVDLQKVVFNGNYLLYFDVSFTEYWRATGLPDAMTQNREGKELFARKASVEYLAGAQFDDLLHVGVRCARLGNSSMTFALEIYRGEEHITSGELLYVYADAHARKSLPLPQSWRKRLTEFERTPPTS
jgi:acyl-CoA thioester hydrolase